ncbi:MAG TPA: ABC transporter permease, partial [Chryseosolibacter sp.]
MLANYLKIAIRQLLRNKVFSTINMVGMAIGLACCLIITLFIVNELQYDQFHTKRDRIFRLISTFKDPSASTLAVTPAPWAPLIASEFPAVESAVRMLKDTRTLIGLEGDQRFYEQNVFFSDPAFFSVFDFPLTQGNADKALTETNTAVLTKSMAEKYFRNEDPIGKTLQITSSFGNELPIVITGVTNDPPEESHFHFSILISIATLGDISNFWSYHMFQSYVLLREGQQPSDLEKLFPAFAEKYINHNAQADGAVSMFLQPLTGIHLHSNLVGEVETNGSITYVYILSGIALCILVLACFNFVNLSTV